MSPLGIIDEETVPAEQLHTALTGILSEQEKRAREIIEENRDALKAVAEAVMNKEALSGDEFREILENNRKKAA